MRYTPHLKANLLITESFQQRFAWFYADNKKEILMTGLLLRILILAIYLQKQNKKKTKQNKFDTFLETSERHFLKDEYENFVSANIETSDGCMPTKPRAKCRVHWGLIAVREKRDEPSMLNKINPTNANAQKL